MMLLVLPGCRPTEAPVDGERPARPNVVLVVVDTLRARELSSYGYPRNTTPHLDAFAREALLFTDAQAPSPSTAPSHASLFTSTVPAVHGIWNAVRVGEETFHPELSANATTLAEALSSAAYQTVGIADGGWVTKFRGLAQGFDTFDSKFLGVRNRIDRALAWLDKERDPSRPFFMFLHTYQVHTPLIPVDGYEDRFDPDYDGPLRLALADARRALASNELEDPLVQVHSTWFEPVLAKMDHRDIEFFQALYDAELSFTDEQIARLFGRLRADDDWDNTVVVVTADHGEEFGEHGVLGHEQLYQEVIRVPLIVRVPGGPRNVRRDDGIDLIDIMPSLLAQLDIAIPASATGRDVGLSSSHRAVEGPPRVAEFVSDGVLTSWRSRNVKVIFSRDPEADAVVFDLAVDPLEADDIAATPLDKSAIAEARQWLERWRGDCDEHAREHGLRTVTDDKHRLDDEQTRQLRALGYLDGD